MLEAPIMFKYLGITSPGLTVQEFSIIHLGMHIQGK